MGNPEPDTFLRIHTSRVIERSPLSGSRSSTPPHTGKSAWNMTGSPDIAWGIPSVVYWFHARAPRLEFRTMPTPPREFVQTYHAMGWTIIPLLPRSKRPVDAAWQNVSRSPEDTEALFELNPSLNIGWLIPEGWVDVDLDTPQAIRMAPNYLPRTEMVFGRRTKPNSHYLYRYAGTLPYSKFSDPSLTHARSSGPNALVSPLVEPGEISTAEAAQSPRRTKTLLELRTIGHQTALPGSVHESGELIEWRRYDGAPEVEADELARQAARLAAAITLSNVWPEGGRHDVTMALAGALHKAGWIADEVWQFLEPVLFEAGDTETMDRQRAVNDTIANFQSRPVTGWPTLERLTHGDSIRQIRTWLLGHTQDIRDLTDQGNALRLFDYFKDTLRYCPSQRMWLYWDGRRWAEDDDQVRAEQRATLVTDYMVERELPVLQANGASEDRVKSFLKHYVASRSANKIRSAVSLARVLTEFHVEVEELDQDPFLLNCPNGTLDLLTGGLKSHDPADYITKLTGADWRPEARSPDWETFIQRTTDGDHEMAGYLQRLAGYSLFFGNPAEKFAIVYGPAGSGKSTFVEVLADTIGGYTATLDPSSLKGEGDQGGSARADLVALRGARMVRTTEIDQGARWSAALVKRLTGGDTLTARKLYKAPIEFVAGFMMFLSTNSRPVVRDTSSGYWRRVLTVPFERVVGADEYDEGLKHRLRTRAREAVLAWAYRGFREYYFEMNQHLGELPDRVVAANAEYREEMDPVAQFIEEMCEVDPSYTEKSSALYDAYKTWCRSMNQRPTSTIVFKTAMESRGYEWARTRIANVHKGIKLAALVEITSNSDPFAGRPAPNFARRN